METVTRGSNPNLPDKFGGQHNDQTAARIERYFAALPTVERINLYPDHKRGGRNPNAHEITMIANQPGCGWRVIANVEDLRRDDGSLPGWDTEKNGIKWAVGVNGNCEPAYPYA